MTTDEVQALIVFMTEAIAHENYDLALNELEKIYNSHLRDKNDTEQMNFIETFIDTVTDTCGFIKRGVIIAGISLGESLHRVAPDSDVQSGFDKYNKLDVLLKIGRALFYNQDAAEIQIILHNKFNTTKSKSEYKKFTP